ncbi:MAG: ParA family protein [Rudaea sp.]|uniref:ParA family protein n=1 Tax=unclassified Rudaea TaxID=2627037 RepID=UPI0014850F8B|nr:MULTISPECIES: ParA family protein [unclassified Rudaea]MBN8888442.1 ParA family protein [Rudaea sp.]MBR0347523.1 ParA family protein [Rudaea sp.]
MTRIIACANLKGGEGKTTLARHVAYHAASRGRKTLAVDLDPQANLTDSLLTEAEEFTSSAALFDAAFSIEQVRPVESEKNLWLLPADARLDALADIPGDRSTLVKRVRASLRAIAGFDLIVVDTPTNAPVCYLGGLAAADGVVSPVQMDAYGIAGAVRLTQAIQRVRAHTNPRLVHIGFAVNRFNSRAASHGDLLAQCRAKRLRLLDSVLHERVAVQDALGRRMPVWRGPRGRVNARAAREMRALCTEVLAGVDL